MTLETFFEKFELFADAPNAVAKMRELVLELAVQGKLVEQDPHDGSSTILIENVRNERTRLIKEKRLQNQTSITPVADFSTDVTLPSNWTWTTLAEIAVINPRNNEDDDTAASFIPMPGIPHIYRGLLNGKIRPWGEIKKAFTHFADGDIALAKITPCFQNGKSVVLRNLSNGIGAGTTELHVARPIGSCIVPEYVWIFLKSPAFINEGIPVMTGSAGQKRVPSGYFALKPFPLPPLAEQKRIVAKVDELMALCDRLEAQQRERETQQAALARAAVARFADAPTPASIELLFHKSYSVSPADLRKTVLTLAVQGKLVPQDPKDEPASQQLEAIRDRKVDLVRQKQIKKADPLRPIGENEIEHDIPDSWAWVRLADICELITDGTHQTPKYTESGRMFLSAQNVKPFKFMPAKHRFVSEEDYQGYIRNRKPEKGDVLLTRVGAGIGEAATVDQELDFAIYVSVGLVRPLRGFVFSDYITLWLNSPDGTEKSSRHTYGKGVSQGNLNLSLIRNFVVPLPPLAEQRRIVAKVEQLMILVDQLEAQLVAARAAATTLMEAVVAELTEASLRVKSSNVAFIDKKKSAA